MKLSEGAQAPHFEATSWDGDAVALDDYAGRKVWLAFFRYASCPLCNLQVHEMRQRAEALRRRGLEIVAVFQSPPESIAEYVGQQAPEFPLLADPEQALYERYGLGTSLAGLLAPSNMGKLSRAMKLGYKPGRMEGPKTRLPADFLIDEAGELVVCRYAKTIGDHISFDEVEAFLDGEAR